MMTNTKKKFDTVEFFRAIKEKLAKKMINMTLKEQKEFLRQIRDGKIKLAWQQKNSILCHNIWRLK